MILSDSDILRALNAGDLVIDPINLEEQLQPASVDVRLGSDFIIWNGTGREIDSRRAPSFDASDGRCLIPDCERRVAGDHGFVILPGSFVLGTTVERVKIPANLSATVEGRSSIGRLGIAVHVTAGFIDPGFEGQITFEIVNFNPNPVRLWPGMRVAQLVFSTMQNPARKPYAGKYQGQVGTTASKSHEDFVGVAASKSREDFVGTCIFCGGVGDAHFRHCSRLPERPPIGQR